MFEKIDSEELSLKVYKMILKMLKEGELDDYTRLPSEMELAEKIGVSRSVVRDALSTLESEGFITRKRGVGTVINKEVAKTTSRLDLESNFMSMVEVEGYKASYKLLSADKETAEDGKEYLLIKKVIYADDKPAIYTEDRIPYKLIPQNIRKEDMDTPSTYGFMYKSGINMPDTILLDIKPKVGDSLAGKMLEIKKTEAYLEIIERGYDINQNLVIMSTMLFRKDVFNFTILRKRIYWSKVFSS